MNGLGAAAALAIALGACAAPAETSDPSPTPFAAPSLPAALAQSPLVLHPWSEEGHGAALPGRLVLEEGCLFVVGEESGERWVPSWPFPGTGWNGSAVVSGGEVISIGEPAVFGGGEGDLSKAEADGIDWVKAPDPACLTTGKAWWVYAGSAPP
jgi:hypothetical protein